MAVSMDRLSGRLSGLRSEFRDLDSSSFSSPLSSSISGSSGLSCPSLTASSTLTSESFSELETDSDASPSHSPFVGTAYDLTYQLLGPLDEFRPRHEPDLATPRPVCAYRMSYFANLEGADEEWYESGEESTIEVGKWRRAAFKRSKASSYVKSSRRKPMMRRFTSGYLTSGYLRTVPSAARNLTESFAPLKGPAPASFDYSLAGSSRAKYSAKSRPKSKMRKSYNDLGIGHPTAWHGEATPKAESDPPKDVPSRLLSRRIRARQESSMKIALKPMDSVLAFVDTPSPIEALPSPFLSDRVLPGLVAQDDRIGMTLSYNAIGSASRIGLGLIDAETASERAMHGCSFRQCVDYSLSVV